MKTLPPLPTSIPSPLGPVRVRLVSKIVGAEDEIVMGKYSLTKREIKISKKGSPLVRWHVLYHEQAHVTLCDAGLHNVLGEEQQEVICDVFATARVVEMLAAL